AAWAGGARLRHHSPLCARRAGPCVPDHLQRRRSAGGLSDAQAAGRRDEPPRARPRSAGAHALSGRQARAPGLGSSARWGAEGMTRALLVVPENNTTMAPELAALCPQFVPFDVARVKRPARTLTREDLPAYADATLAAVEPFLGAAPDLVFYGCT